MVKQANPPKPVLGFSAAETMLTERYGPIGQPLTWFGVHEHGLQAALQPLDHVIDRDGVFGANLSSSAREIVIAYTVSRLIKGRDLDQVPEFRAGKYKFGLVAQVGEVASAELLLGKSFEDGAVEDEGGVMKAHFVSLEGLCATVRQCAEPGERTSFVVNRDGKAEIAIQELLPAAREIITARIPLSLVV